MGRDGDGIGDRDIGNGDIIKDRDPFRDRNLQDPPENGDNIRNGDSFGDRGTIGDSDPSVAGAPPPLAELVATAYSSLAQRVLSSPSPVWDRDLERGLTLLRSQSHPVAGLPVAVATLLLAKATSTLAQVASGLGRSPDAVLGRKGKSQMENVENEKPQTENVEIWGKRSSRERGGIPRRGILEEKGIWEFSEVEERDPLRAPEEEEEGDLSLELFSLPQDETIEDIPENEDNEDNGDSGVTPNPAGSIPSAQPSVPTLSLVVSLLRDGLSWICHCPPGSLYRRLCQLLALALGDRDPLAVAALLAESLGVTARHQLLASARARQRKQRKEAAMGGGGDGSEQLWGRDPLPPQTQPQTEPQSQIQTQTQTQPQILDELEELFQFGPAGLEPQRFREQLREIPEGVTVVQLSLASATPDGFGAALLLTRLERDREPLSVRIGTGNGRAPLSSILQELDLIQRGQREANGVTDRQEWWERRLQLDQRMEVGRPQKPQKLRENNGKTGTATLRNVPVTRLPGLRFLLRHGRALKRSGSVLNRGVNPKSTFYVLNPQRDLGGTEERFRGWFESEPGWQGVSGAAPTPQQMKEALLEHDLYM
ncbi:separin-like [Malurus melanocephalus]|uniref:separin-like n=1 Tax=Malurus melanocephalus TaxID=175006 RepID=UPI0025471E08|nr:separin-like [Malurus melanocephalus]